MRSKIKFQISLDVKKIIDAMAEILNSDSNVYAAILLGSCSRGEESYFIASNGERQLLSDVENLIVTMDGQLSQSTEDKLQALRKKLHYELESPFFDLEWSVKKLSEIHRIDRRFIHFETIVSGWLICGEREIFDLFPKITSKNLNYSELNTIIIHRLYHVIKDYAKIDSHKKKYLIARNSLDILTVIIPYKGSMIPSYKLRMEACTPDLCEEFGDITLKDRLLDYFKMKLDYSSPIFNEYLEGEMLSTFCDDMERLYAFQKKQGKVFRLDWRAIMAACVRLNPERLSNAIRKPNVEQHLYESMIMLLKTRNFKKESLHNISGLMYKYYNYK